MVIAARHLRRVEPSTYLDQANVTAGRFTPDLPTRSMPRKRFWEANLAHGLGEDVGPDKTGSVAAAPQFYVGRPLRMRRISAAGILVDACRSHGENPSGSSLPPQCHRAGLRAALRPALRPPPLMAMGMSGMASGVSVALNTDSLQLKTVTRPCRNDGCTAHHARSDGESHRRAAPSIALASRCWNVPVSARSIPMPATLPNRIEPPAEGLEYSADRGEGPDLLVGEHHAELVLELGYEHQMVERRPGARVAGG